jgi:hypothetical protein
MKPVLKIKGKVQDLVKKEKNKPLMKTNFLLTINTNQQYKEIKTLKQVKPLTNQQHKQIKRIKPINQINTTKPITMSTNKTNI